MSVVLVLGAILCGWMLLSLMGAERARLISNLTRPLPPAPRDPQPPLV